MILRLGSEQLRWLAAQVDAHTALEAAGADHRSSKTVLTVHGRKLAYLAWWEDEKRYLAEFIDFTPGGATPLDYHGKDPA